MDPLTSSAIPEVAARPVGALEADRPPINSGLDEASQDEVKLVDRYSDIFAQDSQTRRTNIPTHAINTGTKRPIKQRPQRLSLEATQTQREEVMEMLAAGVIIPSNSAWASLVVLVNKKDGSKRFCVDYQKLNDVTQQNVYPLPSTEAVLGKLGKAH